MVFDRSGSIVLKWVIGVPGRVRLRSHRPEAVAALAAREMAGAEKP
jgi:hypothetical protein